MREEAQPKHKKNPEIFWLQKEYLRRLLCYLSVGSKINVHIWNRTDNRIIEAVLTGLVLLSPII